MRRFVSLWPAAVSALLMLLAFPPFNLGLLVLVGLAPLFSALMKCSKRKALALGYLFGFIYMFAHMQWLQTLVVRWTNNPGLAFFTWLLCGFIGAWYFALFAWLANRCFKRGWHWIVPLVWVGVEVFRSYIPGLAFPWGLAADPLWRLPQLINGAYFGSIYLISAWCALSSLIIALWMAGEGWVKLRPYVTTFALVLGLSIAHYATPIVGRKMIVTVGQLGVDMAFGNENVREDLVVQSADSMIEAARIQKADLLVLPEGIADGTQSEIPQTGFRIDPNIPIIFGGQRALHPTYQSAYAFDGQTWSHADKNRLVIFGEYVPFRGIKFLENFRLAQGDLTPGETLGTLKVRDRKVGPLICFEGLFPDLSYRQALAGAQMLTVISIDDWYMDTAAPAQLKSASVWRAVETGLPLVRSASLGYTIAVDQRGQLVSEAPLREDFPLHAELAVPDNPRPFFLFPVFPLLCVASLLGALAIPWIPRRKN